MKSKKIILPIILIVIAVAAYFISTKVLIGEHTVKIGVISPLSGEYAVAGENLVKGIELARELHEKSNSNLKVELYIEDDGFNVGKGTSAYKKLIGIDKVDALINLSTPVIDALYPEITKTNIPVIQIGIQTTGTGPDNIFQNSPSADDGIIALAEYSNDRLNFAKIAIVYDLTPGGTIFYKLFNSSYSKESDGYSIGKKDDIKNQAMKILAGKYDAVVILTSPENGALMTNELIRYGYKNRFIYDAQLQTGITDYKRILGDLNRINGALSFWFKDGDKTSFNKFYRDKYLTDAGFVSDFGFDSFNILMSTYSSNNSAWLSNIQQMKSIGASGKIMFDKNGIRKQDININQLKNGELVSIDTVEFN